jgi:probable addiction module antidote protein
MVTETIPFDASRYLDRRGAQAELLNDALISGSAAYIANALRVIARARGAEQVAQDAGMTVQALEASLKKGAELPLDTLMQLVKVLGLELRAESAPEVS